MTQQIGPQKIGNKLTSTGPNSSISSEQKSSTGINSIPDVRPVSVDQDIISSLAKNSIDPDNNSGELVDSLPSYSIVYRGAKANNAPSYRISRYPIVRWFNNLPISRKQLIAILSSQIVPIAAITGIGSALIVWNSRTQLIEQSKAELGTAELGYQIKLNQMRFGYTALARINDIVEAARLHDQGKPVPPDLEATVQRILKNEIKLRRIQYSTLIGSDKRIIVGSNNYRQGEIFNPDDIVSKTLSTGQGWTFNTVVSAKELMAEGGPLPPGASNQDSLIRFSARPVKDPGSGRVLGVLLAGDLVNGTTGVPDLALQPFQEQTPIRWQLPY
jgi:hypothetical protein